MCSKTVPIVEVNDFHMEVFPFWKTYLEPLGIQPVFFLPKEKLLHKKEGTFGGIYTKIVDTQHLHDISYLAYLKPCATLIVNSYVDTNSDNRPIFDWLIKNFHLRFKRLMMVFHGKPPNILHQPDIQCIIQKFESFTPVFLHPGLSRIVTQPPITVVLPIYTYPLPSPEINQGQINLGIVGTLWRDCRNYDMLIEALQTTPCPFLHVSIIGGTVPWGNTQDYLTDKARKAGVLNQLSFKLNLPTNDFLTEIQKLHFICPLIRAKDYLTKILSGCVPLALSLGIPLILRQSLAQAYQIPSQLQYYNHYQI